MKINFLMSKYFLEFILYIQNTSPETIKNSIREFGDNLEIIDCEDGSIKGKNFKIHIRTEDPTIIFDTCAQFGRIKSVKINEAETYGTK